jgi:hypothetical protein
MHSTPFTAEDLERIAKSLREWERLLLDRDAEYRARAELVNSIEVTRPDDGTEVIGRFVLEDGWVGMRFGRSDD